MWYRVTPGCRIALLLSAGCLFFAPSGGFAAESAGKLPPDAMAGKILDPSGKPAAGATVWLIGGPYDGDAKTLERTVSNAYGGFVFPEAQEHIRPKARMPHIAAGDAQGRLGGTGAWVWHGAGKWTPQQALRIKLFRPIATRKNRQCQDGAKLTVARVPGLGRHEPVLAM
jgi:hypothetical protein